MVKADPHYSRSATGSRRKMSSNASKMSLLKYWIAHQTNMNGRPINESTALIGLYTLGLRPQIRAL
jgi:hypothetical protein